ncbi:hypothetical protein B0J12DRAFT_707471 [Macrophomina phaseolina]|uniref:Dihydrodipicolinate synthase n=1 Tax=Macrophomina phaseolina TaxID=35725 RepID=A0ABQ8GT82_9PEZI|nr:hypothetical protein B0J12DRAFT_707471 [Macrophomina phaseolina]
MAPKELTGILCALITPFTADGHSIDAAALDTHVNGLIAAGIHGLVPGGSTGEFTTLTPAERKQLLERVIAYFTDISDAAAGLPIMYCNIPAASGVSLSPEELAGLREVGVRCMKDASGNAPALAELGSRRFNGCDTRTFYGLCAGAKGSVWGAANVVPELCARLWEAVAVRADLREGRELWAKIWPVCKFLESHNYAAAVKAGVDLVGGKTGGLRKPFAPLEEVHRKEFAGLLKAAGVKVVE